MSALFFGSIGSIADTSELQREAFNAAFEEHGLDWSWGQDEYRVLLAQSGGAARIAEQAKARGEEVDADAVHATKSKIFQGLLGERGVTLRDGVSESIITARSEGLKVALVTTTSPENVAALLDAADVIGRDDFDLILDTTAADAPKPDPAVYEVALKRLGEEAGSVVAVEDNVGGVAAASAAGVSVVAFPGENNAAHDFGAADRVVDRLDFSELVELTQAA